MKNKLTDLNDHLFAQLERLGDEELKGDELQAELKRSHAVAVVARRVIENGALVLRAQTAFSEGLLHGTQPTMLGIEPPAQQK